MSWLKLLEVPIIIVLLTYIVTKLFDFLISIWSEKREFQKFKREKTYNEIEELKEELGKLVELTSNWKGYDQKEEEYINNFYNDHELLGKYSKYPTIANSLREILLQCKIVASCERDFDKATIKEKEELNNKYEKFLKKCDDHINRLP